MTNYYVYSSLYITVYTAKKRICFQTRGQRYKEAESKEAKKFHV